ncbi:MAG TPA: 8-amino-7-oxononanoate synthase [Tepidisphaeraceae bacterium]|nr:8-amino-7-oxononanoate synthase [Tepidisphaeraceae bacterium]
MPHPTWENLLENALSARDATNERRARRALRVMDATHVEQDGRRLVNFASNNYLGLTHHPRVIDAFDSAAKRDGVGSAAAALVTGYTDAHASAERAIAAWKGSESAVMLSSGYAANLAAVQAIAAVAGGERRVRFLLDKLAHASLIDAVRGSGAAYRVFPHNHLEKLERLLVEAEPGQLQVLVTESIFSMDGDAADLAGIARLKQKQPFVLLLDEAHGSGVYGVNGAGYASEIGLQSIVDVTIVTLSKAIGVSGGAVCASRAFCDALINFGRSYIYSTNVPPAVAAAAEASIAVMRDEPQRQQRVRALARDFRAGLMEMGLRLAPGGPHAGFGGTPTTRILPRSGDEESGSSRVRSEPGVAGAYSEGSAWDSPILPVILGGESESLKAAERLREAGFLVVAIRPPTVPRGSSRLRITLSSEHRDEEVRGLLEALQSL